MFSPKYFFNTREIQFNQRRRKVILQFQFFFARKNSYMIFFLRSCFPKVFLKIFSLNSDYAEWWNSLFSITVWCSCFIIVSVASFILDEDLSWGKTFVLSMFFIAFDFYQAWYSKTSTSKYRSRFLNSRCFKTFSQPLAPRSWPRATYRLFMRKITDWTLLLGILIVQICKSANRLDTSRDANSVFSKTIRLLV